MATSKLEERVEHLELQLAELQSRLAGGSNQPKDWRRVVEKYAGDEDLLATFAEAKKLRDIDRKKPRQARRKST